MTTEREAIPAASPSSSPEERRGVRVRFDRHELAGAFGDIGTDLPLLVGMIAAARLDAASVLVMFGLMQAVTALSYGMPMPAQPLKAMAVLVIAQRIPGNILFGAGLAIGAIMLLLSVSGGLEVLARVIPKCVVRGLQLGLGLQLALLAARQYVPSQGALGWGLAGAAFLLILALRGNRRLPAALPVIALGVVYALTFRLSPSVFVESAGFSLPGFRVPTAQDILTGLVVLAIPQLPLSLGNALLATRQVAEDLFPERQVTVRKLGLTYAAMNLVNPWFGGVPTCHGSGGLVGHHTFGARTGGSVLLYGSIYLVLGLFFARGFERLVGVFPLPVLGVLLFFEGWALGSLVRDVAPSPREFGIVLLVALIANGVPNGFLVGLLAGTVLYYLNWKPFSGPASSRGPASGE